MGCFPSKPQKQSQSNNVNRDKARRINNWRATGVVSLRDARLKAIPPEVEELGPDLRTVDATNNLITHLPARLDAFCNLQRLILISNKLTELPSNVDLLWSLKVLQLDGNHLRQLPRSIGKLENLQDLSVSDNQLGELPAEIGGLRSLLRLTADGNQLQALPAELGRCSNLEAVRASRNQIGALPEELSQLTRLRELQLDGNRIRSVPRAIFQQCGALQTLSLHGNPITAQEVEAMEGFREFEARRQAKATKAIAGGVLLGAGGFDEGFDRERDR